MKKTTLFLLVLLFIVKISAGQEPDWLWAKSVSNSGDPRLGSMIQDAQGNILLGGYFSTPMMKFGEKELINYEKNEKSADLFIAKCDTSGNIIWAKSAGGTSNEGVISMVADNSGNYIVAGYFTSPQFTLDTFVLTKSDTAKDLCDLFISKFSNSGTVLWAYNVGTVNYAYSNDCSVTADKQGNVYFAGTFHAASVSFGQVKLENKGSSDIFVAKFNSDGKVLWAKSIGGTDSDEAVAVATDGAGKLYMAANIGSDSLFEGSQKIINTGSWDILLMKMDEDGNYLWTKNAIGKESDQVYDIAIDSSGNLCVVGCFKSYILDFGGKSALANNTGRLGVGNDMFLARFDNSGKVTFAKNISPEIWSSPSSVVFDIAGNIYVSGGFDRYSIGYYNGDEYLQSTVPDYHVYLEKFSPEGVSLWDKSAEIAGDGNITDIIAYPDGRTLSAGWFRGYNIYLNPFIMESLGYVDIFMVKTTGPAKAGKQK